MSVSVLPSQFKPTKKGYKSYLKSKGFDYDGVNTPMFAISYPEFLSQSRDRIKDLESRIEKMVNDLHYLTYTLGQDEYDSSTDAYHLNINLRKAVYELDSLLEK